MMANSSTSRPRAADGPGTRTARKSAAAKRVAREDRPDARKGAEDDMRDMASAASDYVRSQKAYAAEQIGGIAEAIERAATELAAEGRGVAGRYARDLSSGLGRLSRSAQATNVDRLMDDVGRFGREHPIAFLGLAALSGFAVSRFASASAERRQRSHSARHAVPRAEPSGGDEPTKTSPIGESEHEKDK